MIGNSYSAKQDKIFFSSIVFSSRKLSVEKPMLYVKGGCPWCIDALAYFKDKQVELEVVDLQADPSRMKELMEISAQTKTPTLKHGDFVVADFDLDEFEQALSENPQAAKDLGLS
jgi:glutaredoxin